MSWYTLGLAKELISRRHAVCLVCRHGPALPEFERLGARTIVFGDDEAVQSEAFPRKQLIAAATEFKPDIIHAQSQNVLPPAAALAKTLKRPFVVTIHECLKRCRELKNLGDRCGGIIAVSEAVREHLVNESKVPKASIKVIPNGIDVREYSVPPARGHDATPVVGTAGALEAIKGHEFFVKAARRILSECTPVQFVIAGNGGEEGSLRRMASDLGLRKEVTFVSEVTSYKRVIGALDVFVMPSLQEGFGFTILEAMALAKPVVASGVGGIYSLVKDGRTGILVPKANPNAIAEAVVKLLTDADLRMRIGGAARKRVKDEFSLSASVSATTDVYDQSLAAEVT